MDTFQNQLTTDGQTTDSQTKPSTLRRTTKRVTLLLRRAAAAGTGGILALGGYAMLCQVGDAVAAVPVTVKSRGTVSAATSVDNSGDVSGDVSGALVVVPQLDLRRNLSIDAPADAAEGDTVEPGVITDADAFARLTGFAAPATQPSAFRADEREPTESPAQPALIVSKPADVKRGSPAVINFDADLAARLAAVTWQPATQPATRPAAANAVTAEPIIRSGLSGRGQLTLSVNRTAEIKTHMSVKRVSIGQPEIADVQPFASNIILVTAKKPGTTQVIVWDDQNRSESIDVNVEIPLDQLKILIGKVAPDANIEVAVAGDQIVLRGQAPNLTTAKQVSDLAGAFGKVQNFIEVAGAQTVAVQVQFAEVSRSVTNSLGVNWSVTDGTTVFGNQIGGIASFGGVGGGITGTATSAQAELFGQFPLGGSQIGFFIKALRENNLLRVLQEPTLTTTSGEAASFLAGGQVAVPVPADNGQVAIEYKEFGVRLKLTPVVLGNGKIRLVLEAESSELDYTNGTKISGAAVPGLRTRRVQNTVELGEGQTISVAGLLDDSVVATRQSVPGLGDIPVLGQLFRSTRYQRKETELVVLITPRLAGAMNPDQVQPLPGAGWRHPNELEQLAFGDLGGNKEADAVKDWNKPANKRGLRKGETQRSTARYQEPAALTRDGRPAPLPPPPAFMGEHGFTQAKEATATTGKD